MSEQSQTVARTARLNGTDIAVSRIAFGCMSTVSNIAYDGVERDEAIATIRAAIDAGITLFDTAPAYGDGESERLLGEAVRGRRGPIVIATKASGGELTADNVQHECEASLGRLGVDCIDLYQVHWPCRTVPLAETMGAMAKLREAGKVRAIGVSNFGPRDMAEALRVTDYATNQVVYNLLMRAAESAIGALGAARDVGVLCYSPLAQGLLTGRYRSADDVPDKRARSRHFAASRPQARHGEPGCEPQTFDALARVRRISEELGQPMPVVALAWLLHQPMVTSVLVGASRPQQVLDNLRALDVSLTPDQLAQLDAATLPVKHRLGDSLDCWQSPPRPR